MERTNSPESATQHPCARRSVSRSRPRLRPHENRNAYNRRDYNACGPSPALHLNRHLGSDKGQAKNCYDERGNRSEQTVEKQGARQLNHGCCWLDLPDFDETGNLKPDRHRESEEIEHGLQMDPERRLPADADMPACQVESKILPASIHRRSNRLDIANCCGRNAHGSCPSASVTLLESGHHPQQLSGPPIVNQSNPLHKFIIFF
jgi:hypothetical protein